ncbi:MAG TPA: hypothetical protein VIJ59_04380 [Caulobacteraceae bacterium]
MSVDWLLSLAFSLTLVGGPHSGSPPPSAQDIRYIESKVSLPDDAPGPLSSYERYYAWTMDNGKKYIYAEYVSINLLGPNKPDPPVGHSHAVTEQDIPTVSNGGCGVITFYFNPRADHTPSLYCNAVGPSAAP